MFALDLFLPLLKVDLDRRLVSGIATPETPDRAGEIFGCASSKPYCEQWSAEALAASGGKSFGAVRAMYGPVAQLASAITADNSRNATLAFDGLLTVGFNPANGAYVQTLASETPETGTFMTPSSRGSIPRDRQYADADVEQLSAFADGDLRQRAGAEEHHQQVLGQRLRAFGRYNANVDAD